MAEGGNLEREVKLGAWPGFVVPDLTAVLPWVHVGQPTESTLDATYYDTADLRLIRWGITLRHRTGGGELRWTLKLPSEGDAVPDDGLARTELDVDGPQGDLPEELLRHLKAFVRTAPLEVVARLQTRRRSLPLLDGGGRVLGSIDDDEVSVLEGDRVAARFREVEVEVVPTVTLELLDAIVARLREAGAGEPDPTPKLARALGPRALAPPEVVVPGLDDEPTVGEVAHAAIASAVLRILAHDQQIRLDAGPEGVHQARVGTRRLRSDLRTFAPVLAEGWGEALRDELSWLADELGRVRDADVLDERLHDAVDQLPVLDRLAARPLLERLREQRAEALAALHAALDDPRYLTLLDHLVAAAAAPRFSEVAERSAEEVLPKLVRRPWRKLVRLATTTGKDAPDAQLHEVRIKAKRARYAAEAAAPAIEAARPHGKAIAEVQSVLGDHHDAIVAEGWLREAAADLAGEAALVAGLLVAAERAEALRQRRAWAGAWDKAASKKKAGWL